MFKKIKRLLFGAPRDFQDPGIFHHVSLVAFLAWVGLGADGLSSSAYGPDEAFRALGAHTHLAILLVLMTAATIFVISIAYSNVIEHFPGGGGGYLVATKLLGEKSGVVSGCALLVDYVLTISVSIASGCDAIWSFLPPQWAHYKLMGAVVLLTLLLLLNLRGVRESVTILAPIFILFVAAHIFMILYALGRHLFGLPAVFHAAAVDMHASVQSMGFFPVLLILLRAYSMGGGTYTGIEAVSNGVGMLREPRVKTGKKTMFLMATSLAFTAGGILFGYLLTDALPEAGKTMNAVLLSNLFGSWQWGGLAIGRVLVIGTLISEAALLLVAAQAGFLDGPRVLSNMAVDSWVPRRFSHLSERLVTKNGICLMAAAALLTLFYTRGNITTLVVMYSINVFLTFSLTELGMTRHWITTRRTDRRWKRQLPVHLTGLVMCVCILFITLYEKFSQGGWVTVLITSATIGLCFLIRRHYHAVRKSFQRLDEVLAATQIPAAPAGEAAPLDRKAPTAVLTVPGFSGFGLHHYLAIQKMMPGHFKSYIFISVGSLDSGSFKGAEEVHKLEEETRAGLQKYVDWCRAQGLNAEYRTAMAVDTVQALDDLCHQIAAEFPKAIFFSGKLIFKNQAWYHNILHNETAYALQRRLQFDGIQAIVLPIRAT